MLTRLVAVAAAVLALAACGTQPVGTCSQAQSEQLTQADGGTITCSCMGACGCFGPDGGRCP